MSPDPKKPIEELLEATARARRSQFGAEPKMPNPMRADLHQEIQRVAQGDESQPSGRWFRLLWPRLAFATSFALIIVSISTLWWWHEHPTDGRESTRLAMQQPREQAPAPETVFGQGAGASSAAPSFADSNATTSPAVESARDTDALGMLAETSITPSIAPSTNGFAAGENRTDQSFLADKSLAAKEARPAEAAAASIAKSRQITNFRQRDSQKQLRQSFRSKLKQTPNILNEFQVEQTDHEIRLVDADGSTYSGKLEPGAQKDARSVDNQNRNSNAPSSGTGATPVEKTLSANAEYYFRVTGFNARLKKSVVIEGNYIGSPAVAPEKVGRAKSESKERDEESSARITGVAKIDGESDVQINALAVP